MNKIKIFKHDNGKFGIYFNGNVVSDSYETEQEALEDSAFIARILPILLKNIDAEVVHVR